MRAIFRTFARFVIIVNRIKTMYRSVIALLFLFIACSCSAQKSSPYENSSPIPVKRFDQELYRLTGEQGEEEDARLLREYPEMFEVFGKGVLNMQSPNQPGFFNKLRSYFSEPALRGLYRDALAEYDSIGDIQSELGYAFACLKELFPDKETPDIYMHVSGFNQNVLVGENVLSLSIDKYLGSDYSLYREFFQPYQRIRMQRANVSQDYLKGWIMSEFPFAGKELVLLDRMIYEGKILYLLSRLLPDREPEQLLGFTTEELQWCRKYEKDIWKRIVEQKHLYTPDRITTNRYLDETPATFLADEAPGYIGNWIGWQIVSGYIDQTKDNVQVFMNNANAQEILSRSKYNPF